MNQLRGIVIIDKPEGFTSYQTVEKVRSILKARKAGHSGTLDMGVTGVLIVALDEAVKMMPVLMGLDKEYEGVMHLHKDISITKVRGKFKEFMGIIMQKPPVKSRVLRKPRPREVYDLEAIRKKGKDVTFRIHCESGLYVRKIIHDIGESLGTGAHMSGLRRIRVHNFSESEALSLPDLERKGTKAVMSLEKALKRVGLRGISIKDGSARKALYGNFLTGNDVKSKDRSIKEGETIGIFHNKKIIALGKYSSSHIKIDRIIH